MPPAARVADPTTHGAPLAPGPGSTDVLIGYMPAWRAMIDQHACPMVSITGPDGVGMVMMGSPTVLIDFMMACRQGDIVMEIPGLAMGPANPIIMGCPTVQIGEVGMGGAATGMGMGMSMAKSSAVGTTSQNPSTLSQPASPQALVAVPASFTAPTLGSLQWDTGSGSSGSSGGDSSQDSQSTNTIVCGIVADSIQVHCQHHGRQPADGILAVVPSVVGDSIACSVQIIGSCGPHPTWQISGASNDTKNGASMTFHATALQGLGKSKVVKPVWLGDIAPNVYNVNVSSCSGPSFSFEIDAYPSDSQEASFAAELYEEALKPIRDGVNDILEAWLGKGKGSFDFLKGSGKYSAQWKEVETNNKAFYSWSLSLGLAPLLGFGLRLPLGPAAALPGILSSWGSAGFFFEAKGEVNLQAQGGQINPPDSEEGHFKATVEGTATAAIGASVYLGNREGRWVGVEAAVQGGFGIEMKGKMEGLRPTGPWEGKFSGLKGSCLFHGFFYEKKSECTFMEEVQLGGGTWDPFSGGDEDDDDADGGE